jgi:hypothetical protein
MGVGTAESELVREERGRWLLRSERRNVLLHLQANGEQIERKIFSFQYT